MRTLLSNPQIAQTKAIQDFLTFSPITPEDADVEDIARRKAMDEKRVEEQKEFYEIARKRAAELDVYMEQYVFLDCGVMRANSVDSVEMSSKPMASRNSSRKLRISQQSRI